MTQPLHANLTDEGHSWWHRTAHDLGTTATALLQAIADRGDTDWIDEDLVAAARAVNTRNRHRPHLQQINRNRRRSSKTP